MRLVIDRVLRPMETPVAAPRNTRFFLAVDANDEYVEHQYDNSHLMNPGHCNSNQSSSNRDSSDSNRIPSYRDTSNTGFWGAALRKLLSISNRIEGLPDLDVPVDKSKKLMN